MFEDKTFENILTEMKNQIPDTFDKREGSMIYNALAPAALVLRQMYMDLEQILKETFADTASREYLIKRAYERGIQPLPATKAIMKGEFDIDVPIGSRFSLENLNYRAIEKIDDGIFKMECETAGAMGSGQTGRLIPIDYISGLMSAAITEIILPGEDEEDTEALRNRYVESLKSEAFGGNVQDYKLKVNAIEGVGGVKIIPAWNGGGTVKVIIVNSEYSAPGTDLIDHVQTALDPLVNQGEGLGIAPIGHVVTVEGVVEETLDIAMTITYQSGWIWQDIEGYVCDAIDEYFLELAQLWQESDSLMVRISQIETRILDINGVVDITGTMINGVESNHVVNGIPKRGTVSG